MSEADPVTDGERKKRVTKREDERKRRKEKEKAVGQKDTECM